MKYSKSRGRLEGSGRTKSISKAKVKKLIQSRELAGRDRGQGPSGVLSKLSFGE